jgi:hypothetical protein
MTLAIFAVASCLTIASALSAPVHVQEEGAAAGGIQEIVVHARRRSETSQGVPVAITAISGDDLVNRSLVTAKDIQTQKPSLQVMPASNNPTSVFLSIRAQTNADIRLDQDLDVSPNGWHDMGFAEGFSNNKFCDPRNSNNLFASESYGATSPVAPEASRQESYWIYRSNYPGIYAGGNDYFRYEHDLRRDGHLLDTRRRRSIC